jgi:hypothetical protein
MFSEWQLYKLEYRVTWLVDGPKLLTMPLREKKEGE